MNNDNYYKHLKIKVYDYHFVISYVFEYIFIQLVQICQWQNLHAYHISIIVSEM